MRVPKIVRNGVQSVLCMYTFIMDLLDERVLAPPKQNHFYTNFGTRMRTTRLKLLVTLCARDPTILKYWFCTEQYE